MSAVFDWLDGFCAGVAGGAALMVAAAALWLRYEKWLLRRALTARIEVILTAYRDGTPTPWCHCERCEGIRAKAKPEVRA